MNQPCCPAQVILTSPMEQDSILWQLASRNDVVDLESVEILEGDLGDLETLRRGFTSALTHP
jgi:hypothetical protein